MYPGGGMRPHLGRIFVPAVLPMRRFSVVLKGFRTLIPPVPELLQLLLCVGSCSVMPAVQPEPWAALMTLVPCPSPSESSIHLPWIAPGQRGQAPRAWFFLSNPGTHFRLPMAQKAMGSHVQHQRLDLISQNSAQIPCVISLILITLSFLVHDISPPQVLLQLSSRCVWLQINYLLLLPIFVYNWQKKIYLRANPSLPFPYWNTRMQEKISTPESASSALCNFKDTYFETCQPPHRPYHH